MNSGLRARILTALLLAALVIVVLIWLPPEVAVVLISLAIFAAGFEWRDSCSCARDRRDSPTPRRSCWR